MEHDDFKAAAERLNTGAEVPTVAPGVIKAAWDAASRIPREQRQRTAFGIGAFAMANAADVPQNAEQRVAFIARYSLLDALMELGILDDYLNNDSTREKVFTAVASFPCNKYHLGEAMAQKQLREALPEAAEKIRAELRELGYDPDHPLGEAFKQWMHDHC